MYKTLRLGMILCVVALCAQAQSTSGEAVYKAQCALCHDNSAQTRAPDLAALKQRTPEVALASLSSGTMGGIL